MRDLAPPFDAGGPGPGHGPENVIVLARVPGGGCWMLEGEAHLDALLSNSAPYPLPVRCIDFASEAALSRALAGGPPLSGLWRIHPAILRRLVRADQLAVIDFDAAG
ncbi:MAG: hypothetical protein VYD87_01470 [Pseudomonadota bacterium]|nr:hypothetical protein [Pseudomonadota bacterium]